MKLRLAALAAVLALALGTQAVMAALMPHVTNQPSRFSGPGVYTGAPALAVTLSMVMAGGGPAHFSTLTLVKTLAGAKTNAELASLTKKFGKAKIGHFVTVFDFVVADTLKIVTKDKIKLPSKPSPNPKNGKALADALFDAGQTGNGFNVEVMLDRAVSHGIHDQVMKDIDAKYGIAADADYHAVLNQAMLDLASVYGLKAD